MIKLKTSQAKNVLNRLINKNVLKNPVYLSPDGLIINPEDKEATLRVFKEMDLKVNSSKNILGRVLIS